MRAAADLDCRADAAISTLYRGRVTEIYHVCNPFGTMGTGTCISTVQGLSRYTVLAYCYACSLQVQEQPRSHFHPLIPCIREDLCSWCAGGGQGQLWSHCETSCVDDMGDALVRIKTYVHHVVSHPQIMEMKKGGRDMVLSHRGQG